MQDPLDVQVRTRLASLLEGEITVREFYHWFLPATWEVERHANSETVSLAYDLIHLYSELTSGDLTREDVWRELESIAAAANIQVRRRTA